MSKKGSGSRIEKDLLGERKLPRNVYYGIQTLRAMENFDISGIRVGRFPKFVQSLAMVKKACVRANLKFKLIDKNIAQAIEKDCDRVIPAGITFNPSWIWSR
jgi:aspartate ammonia-lyase